jgi:hypothetical protein
MLIKIVSAIVLAMSFASASFAREAIVNCSISYVSPDGQTTVDIVNQTYAVPLRPGVRYVSSVLLGDRRLDISAQDIPHEGWRSVSIFLWQSNTGGRYLCSETNNSYGGVADCDFRSRTSNEMARISCGRAD